MSSQTGRSYGVGYDVLGEDYFPNFQVLKPETLVDMSGDIALDTQTHGTHVAQLAALGNPSVGLIPVRVLPAVKKPGYQELYDNDYPQFLANVAHQMVDSVTTGIAFAASNGATIINMSIGISIGELRPPDRDALMTRIRNQLVPRMETEWSSVLMVVAASNEGKKMEDSSQMIPATLDLPDILCVGALESSRSLIANYSNWGRYVDVYIRGTDIRSAVPDGGWERMSGTSMAAPLITHLAAELKLIDASLTPRELRALILNTAKVENLPVAPKENSLPSPPAIRMVRVADFLAAKRRARELQAASPEERKVWLTPPYVHGAAPF